jgi:hypothetical protein
MEEGDSCHLWLAVLLLYTIPGISIGAFLKIFITFFNISGLFSKLSLL